MCSVGAPMNPAASFLISRCWSESGRGAAPWFRRVASLKEISRLASVNFPRTTETRCATSGTSSNCDRTCAQKASSSAEAALAVCGNGVAAMRRRLGHLEKANTVSIISRRVGTMPPLSKSNPVATITSAPGIRAALLVVGVQILFWICLGHLLVTFLHKIICLAFVNRLRRGGWVHLHVANRA